MNCENEKLIGNGEKMFYVEMNCWREKGLIYEVNIWIERGFSYLSFGACGFKIE